MLNAVYNTFCTFQNGICELIVDCFGRARLLLIGVIGCAICLDLEAAMVAQFGGTTNRVGQCIRSLLSLLLYRSLRSLH
jgi:hypothetical protein